MNEAGRVNPVKLDGADVDIEVVSTVTFAISDTGKNVTLVVEKR